MPLKPAKATNYGLGFVITPASNVTLTVDAYNIKVRDRIFISQPFFVTPADIVALPALASVGVGGTVQYFTNSFDTRTRGIDLVGTYRTDLAGGDLNLTLAYNHNKTKVTKFDPGTISRAQIIDAERLAPSHRVNLTAAWKLGTFGINATEHFYGSWRASSWTYPGQKFGSKFTTDVEVKLYLHGSFHAVGRREQPVRPISGQDRSIACEPDLLAHQQPGRWPGLSPQRRSVRDQRRLLVRPAPRQILSRFAIGADRGGKGILLAPISFASTPVAAPNNPSHDWPRLTALPASTTCRPFAP